MYTDCTFSYIKKLERDRRNRSELLKEAGKEKMSESRTDNRQKQALRTKELDFLLCDSIENDFRGFSIHYQPQIRTSSGTLYGAEALARWQCARYGNVGPEEFIPVLEENGRIVELGRWIFRKAAQQCVKWCRLQPDFRMSVNLSCRHLEKTGMAWFARTTLRQLGLPARNMMLELTESWPLCQGEEKEELVLGLEQTGIGLAMDDFGSGYSSLLSLQRLPFQMIKIDKAFVKGPEREKKTAALVPSLTQLCHSIGRQVCLEGVETKEEYEAVRRLEIEVMQGFYFGRPVPAEVFERLYF